MSCACGKVGDCDPPNCPKQYEAKPQYHDWLDELLAERDTAERAHTAALSRAVHAERERDALAARLAEAERQRDEALASVVLYVNERDAARDGWEAQVRSEEREMRRRIEAEARADNLAPLQDGQARGDGERVGAAALNASPIADGDEPVPAPRACPCRVHGDPDGDCAERCCGTCDGRGWTVEPTVDADGDPDFSSPVQVPCRDCGERCA